MPTNKSVSPTEFRLHSKLFNIDCAPSNYFEQLRFEMIFQQLITWFWRVHGIYFYIQKVKKMDQKILFQFFFYKTYLVTPVAYKKVKFIETKSIDSLSYNPLKLVLETKKRETMKLEAEKIAESKWKTEITHAENLDSTLIKSIEADVLAIRQITLEKQKKEKMYLLGPEIDIKGIERKIKNPTKNLLREKRKKDFLEREETEWDSLALFNPELFFYLWQLKKKIHLYKLGFKKVKTVIFKRIKCKPRRLKTVIYYHINPILMDKKRKNKKKFMKGKKLPKKKWVYDRLVQTRKYTKRQLSFSLFFTYFFLHFFKSQSVILAKSLYKAALVNRLFKAEQRRLMRKLKFLEKYRWSFDFIFLLNYALTFSNMTFILPYFLSQVVRKFRQLRYAQLLFNVLRHLYFFKRNIHAIKVLLNGTYDKHGRSRFKMLHIGNLAMSNMHSCIMYDAIQWRTPFGTVSLKLWVYYTNYFMLHLLKVGNEFI